MPVAGTPRGGGLPLAPAPGPPPARLRPAPLACARQRPPRIGRLSGQPPRRPPAPPASAAQSPPSPPPGENDAQRPAARQEAAGRQRETGLSSVDDLERVDGGVRYQVKRVLGTLDENGLWTVMSCLVVYAIFLLETFNYDKLGGWDVLYRDDIAWYNLLFPISTLQGIESVLNTIFIMELVARAYGSNFSRAFFLSPYTWVDALVCLPPLVSPDIDGLRLLRVLRVLRLLRLLDRRADTVLFGFIQTKETEVQLVGILAEFVCIFCITAGVIYDLEVQVNSDVNTLADCLYWSFLTLTGIGQPFEIVTAGGKVATVISVCVALLVVPGQLAKLAAITGSRMISEMMDEDEDEDGNLSTNYGMQGTIAGGPGAAAAALVKSKVKKRFRRRLVDSRVCASCDLKSHDLDAAFCRKCGAALPSQDDKLAGISASYDSGDVKVQQNRALDAGAGFGLSPFLRPAPQKRDRRSS